MNRDRFRDIMLLRRAGGRAGGRAGDRTDTETLFYNIETCKYEMQFLVVKCPPIKNSEVEIYNVTCTTDTKVYNDTCEVSCELGYNLTSSDGVHKCTENGTWSNNVTCKRMLCFVL
jgi:hypothetical protein